MRTKCSETAAGFPLHFSHGVVRCTASRSARQREAPRTAASLPAAGVPRERAAGRGHARRSRFSRPQGVACLEPCRCRRDPPPALSGGPQRRARTERAVLRPALSLSLAMVDQGQLDADMLNSDGLSRGQLHQTRLCDDPWLLQPSFASVALAATPPTPAAPPLLPAVGSDGASARQESSFRGHPPGSRGETPQVPSHCFDDAVHR